MHFYSLLILRGISVVSECECRISFLPAVLPLCLDACVPVRRPWPQEVEVCFILLLCVCMIILLRGPLIVRLSDTTATNYRGILAVQSRTAHRDGLFNAWCSMPVFSAIALLCFLFDASGQQATHTVFDFSSCVDVFRMHSTRHCLMHRSSLHMFFTAFLFVSTFTSAHALISPTIRFNQFTF